MHHLLLGLILPEGKGPFTPVSVLGARAARQGSPASTGVSGAFFAVRFDCCFQLIRCLPAHLCKRTSRSCLSAFRQPSLRDVRKRNKIRLSKTHDCLTVQGAMFSFTCEQQSIMYTERDARAFANRPRFRMGGTFTVTSSAAIHISVKLKHPFPVIWYHNVHLAR